VRSYPALLHNRIQGGPGAESGVLALASTLYMEGNLLDGWAWGLSLSGRSAPIIRSNVFLEMKEGGVRVEDEANVILRNNIFLSMDQGVFVDYARTTLSHNCFSMVEKPYWTISDETGEEVPFEPDPGVGELLADPRFESARDRDVRLAEDSPCRGAGIHKPSESGAADMGCFPAGEAYTLGPLEGPEERMACKPGDTMAVNHVDEEYRYLRAALCECGGSWKPHRQALMHIDGRPHDKLSPVCTSCGKEGRFVFDISRFFGEPFLVGRK
jgi:hypothetical protein